MKRDFDLIRLLLRQVEGEGQIDLSSFTSEQINYHKALLIEAGLVKGKAHYSSRGGPGSEEIPDVVHMQRLTWEGHEFIDKAKNDTAWEKAKKYVQDQGLSLSIESLKIALSAVITKMLT